MHINVRLEINVSLYNYVYYLTVLSNTSVIRCYILRLLHGWPGVAVIQAEHPLLNIIYIYKYLDIYISMDQLKDKYTYLSLSKGKCLIG